MNYVRVAIVFCAVIVLTLAWGQYRQIGLQRELISSQAEVIETAIENLETIKGLVESSGDQMVELLTAQGKVQSILSVRTQEIRRLQNDVKEIREWADQPLPADIVRMRRRPAAQGAIGYGQSVPAGGAVQAASSGPENERRDEPDARTD